VNDDPGRLVSDWLHEYGAHRVPNHLDAVLGETSTRRQRPAWSSLERWLPMDLTTRASTLAPLRLGRLVVIALLVLALAAATFLVVGSRQPRIPAPFGPAANGIRIASSDGDIYVLDATTQVPRTLITDPSYDFGTTWSRDGTRFLFLRAAAEPVGTESQPLSLAVANADGSDVRVLAGPVAGLDWFDWSPDGRQIVYLTQGGAADTRVINVVDVATRQVTTLDVGVPAVQPMWLPPDGREILFRSQGPSPALYAIRPDGTGKHALSTRLGINKFDFGSPNVSPDGGRVLYTSWNESDGLRLYVLDVATGAERRLPTPAGTIQGGGVFSPDGQSVAYPRSRARDTFEIVVAPADGSSEGETLGGVTAMGPDGMGVTLAFSPDGTALVARFGNDAFASYKWIPLDGSPMTTLDQGSFEFVDVQRLAR
jgi:dipeptidyl aminopeptidase/acylaminoacyl peptidase